jgi:hypothetical protein
VPILPFRGAYRLPYTDINGKRQILETEYGIQFVHRRTVFSKTVKNDDGTPKIEKIIVVACTAGVAERSDGAGGLVLTTGDDHCPGCEEAYLRGRKGPVSFATRQHIFNLVLMAHFHAVKERSKKDSTKEYTVYKPCTGRGCKLCREGNEERTFGLTKYMELGPSHAEAIGNLDLRQLSFKCRCGGNIEYVGFECEHCGQMLQSIDSNPWAPEELDELRTSDWECTCGHVGAARQLVQCTSCNEPEALTLWTTVMRPYRTGENKQSTLTFGEVRPVTQEELDAVQSLLRPIPLNMIAPVLTPAEMRRELLLEAITDAPQLRARGESQKTKSEDKAPPQPPEAPPPETESSEYEDYDISDDVEF